MVAPGVVTRNLLGPDDGTDPFARLPRAIGASDAHVHWYGKESRPGRKIGHVTARAGSEPEADRAAHAVWSVLATGEGC
jgi:5-(carboxyamino)imidazole ribonucleotide synthase